MEDSEILATLKCLIQTLEDGKKGFREASAEIKGWEASRLLADFSDQRTELSAQLQTVGAAFGDSAYDQGSSVAGAMHRGWIDLRAAIASHSAHSVLSECERGEDHAVAEFQKALEKELPVNVREVVERQASDVKAAHDKIKQLRDLAKAAHE